VTAPTPEVEVTRAGPVLHIRLNRADKRNAITGRMYEAMAAALAEADADAAIRAVLFSGAGQGFCAGNDLNDFVTAPPTDAGAPGFRFLRAISTAEKVLVAAIHGNAVGVGTTMLLHCDLVVAARGARLSLPFIELGLVPEAASTLLLPRAVGHLRAAQLLLLAAPIDAETALRWGLVNDVVDDASLMDAAAALTARIAALPPSALRMTKRLLRDDEPGIARRIAREGEIFRTLLGTPEFREAATAFRERRPADFSRLAPAAEPGAARG
jgi:enoyl-CoA hydratase/carnithine racemase